MSHDEHGHDSGPAKPSNPFFLIGLILMFAFFAVSRSGTSNTTTSNPTVPRAVPTPPIQQQLPRVGEKTPTYNPNIVKAPGPEPNRVKMKPQVSSIAPWGYALTFASQFAVIQKLLEGQTYQKKHTIKTVNVGPDGPMLEQAMVRLTPNDIQNTDLKLITYFQHLTANHKNCYYDEDGGNEHVPDEGVFQPVAINWNTLRAGAAGLQPVMSTGNLPLSGYNFYMELPDESVTPQNGLACGTQMEGKPIGLYDMGDNEEIYTGSDNNQWSAQEFCSPGAIAKYEQCLAEQANCDKEDKNKPQVRGRNGECKKCTLSCSGDAHTVFSTRLPDADRVNANIGKIPGGPKLGFVYTQLPDGFNFNKDNGINTQDHTLQIPICKGCEVTSETSVYYLEALRREHLKALHCSLTPKELQDLADPCPTPEPDKQLAGIRNGNDAIDPRQPAQCGVKKPISPNVSHGGLSAAITAAAAWAKLPACVLQGVAEIEGATEEMAQSACIPNQCGAAGPFQISVGQDTCGKKTCDDCGPNWKGRACNDESWALKAAGGTAADACNINIAAKAAAAVVMGKANGFGVPFNPSLVNSPSAQRQSIIIASDAYYGVTSPIPRLNGLSYGEYVYSKCDPSYTTHVDHNFP